MSCGATSGLEWAKELPGGARIHWAELDVHVLRDHPHILSLLGPEAYEVTTRRRSFTIMSLVVLVPAIILGLAIFWAPLWGLATLAGDSFGIVDVDGAMAIPVAGASMVVSFLVMCWLPVRRAFRHGVGGTDDHSLTSSIIVLGMITLIMMITIGVRQQPDGWEVWVVPTAAAILLAVVNFFVSRRLNETPGAFATRRPATPGEQMERRQRVRAAVEALPEDERSRLVDDRRRAIAWLRMQGTITPDEAERASRAELGAS